MISLLPLFLSCFTLLHVLETTQILKFADAFKAASMVVMDANLRMDTMVFLLKMCKELQVPGKYSQLPSRLVCFLSVVTSFNVLVDSCRSTLLHSKERKRGL